VRIPVSEIINAEAITNPKAFGEYLNKKFLPFEIKLFATFGDFLTPISRALS